MFNLINTTGNDVDYIESLAPHIEKVRKEAQSMVNNSSKTVTVQLVHEYQITKKPRSVANIRYNTEERLPNGKVECGSCIEPLEEGTNYSMDPLNNLIEQIVQDVNSQIDAAALFGEMLGADDIQDRVSRSFKQALESVYIWDGLTISTVVIANQLSEIIVVVC